MEALKPYREKIDALDDSIIDLLGSRFDLIREVAIIKAANNIPAILEDRIDEVRERCAARAAAKGIDAELARCLYTMIISASCDLEEEVMAKS